MRQRYQLRTSTKPASTPDCAFLLLPWADPFAGPQELYVPTLSLNGLEMYVPRVYAVWFSAVALNEPIRGSVSTIRKTFSFSLPGAKGPVRLHGLTGKPTFISAVFPAVILLVHAG